MFGIVEYQITPTFRALTNVGNTELKQKNAEAKFLLESGNLLSCFAKITEHLKYEASLKRNLYSSLKVIGL